MWQVISFDQANAMLACGCAFEFDRAFDHFVDKMGGFVEVLVAVV
jgi:hypothetical protein